MGEKPEKRVLSPHDADQLLGFVDLFLRQVIARASMVFFSLRDVDLLGRPFPSHSNEDAAGRR